MAKQRSLVHSDKEILSGMAVFKGTRVPVKNLFDYLAAWDSLEVFLDEFPSVTREQVLGVIKLAGDYLIVAVENESEQLQSDS